MRQEKLLLNTSNLERMCWNRYAIDHIFDVFAINEGHTPLRYAGGPYRLGHLVQMYYSGFNLSLKRRTLCEHVHRRICECDLSHTCGCCIGVTVALHQVSRREKLKFATLFIGRKTSVRQEKGVAGFAEIEKIPPGSKSPVDDGGIIASIDGVRIAIHGVGSRRSSGT